MLFQPELIQVLLGNVLSFPLSSEIQQALYQFFKHVFHYTETTVTALQSAFSCFVSLHQKYDFSQLERELAVWFVSSHVSAAEHERRTVLRECMANTVYFQVGGEIQSGSNSNPSPSQISFAKLCLLFDILTVFILYNNDT